MDRLSTAHDSQPSYRYRPQRPDTAPPTPEEIKTLGLGGLHPRDRHYVKRHLPTDTVSQMLDRAAPDLPYPLLEEPCKVFAWSHENGKMRWFLRVIEHQVLCWQRLSDEEGKPIEPRPSEWLLDIVIWCRSHGAAGHAPQTLAHELADVIDTFARQDVRLTGLLCRHQQDAVRMQAIGETLMSTLSVEDGWLIPVLEHCADGNELSVFLAQIQRSFAAVESCGTLCATALNSGQIARWDRALRRFPDLFVSLRMHQLIDIGSGLGQLIDLNTPFGVSARVDWKFGPAVQALANSMRRATGLLTAVKLQLFCDDPHHRKVDDHTLGLLKDAITANRSLQLVSLAVRGAQAQFMPVAQAVLEALANTHAPREPVRALRIAGPLNEHALTALKGLLYQGRLMSLYLDQQADLLVLEQVFYALAQSAPDCMPYSLIVRSDFDTAWEQAVNERQQEMGAAASPSAGPRRDADAHGPTPAQTRLRRLLDKVRSQSHVQLRTRALECYRSLWCAGRPMVVHLPMELLLPSDAQALRRLFEGELDWHAIRKELGRLFWQRSEGWGKPGPRRTPTDAVLKDVMAVVDGRSLSDFVEQRVSDKAWMSADHIDKLKRALKPYFPYEALQGLHRCLAPVDPATLDKIV